MNIDEAIEATAVGKNVDRRRDALRRAITDDVRAAVGEPFAAYSAVAVPPPKGRANGTIALISESAVALVDSGSKGDRRQVIRSADIVGVTTVMDKFGMATLRITSTGGVTDVAIPSDQAASLLADLSRLVSPSTVDSAPWWRLPSVRFPKAPLRLDYLGGLPGADRERDGVTVRFDDTGVHLSDPGKMLRWEHDIRWEHVHEVAIEGFDLVQRRITVTRLLTIGVFALGWRKRERSAFVVLDLGAGEVIFASRRKTVPQLRAELGTLVSASERHAQPPAAPVASAGDGPPSSAGDRLRELKGLLDDGLIDQAEFDAKRQAILDEL